MVLTDADIPVLQALCRFYVMTRSQIHRVCFPHHKDGRATRKRLKRLVFGGYVRRHEKPVVVMTHSAAPVYFLTPKALRLLASHFDDEQFLHARTNRPRSDRLEHWIAITETHITIEQAIKRQNLVTLDAWHNEWTTVNKEEHRKEHFMLHTVFRRNPPLSCSPDAGFMLSISDHSLVYYLEQDRDTSHAKKVAVSKTPGYLELLQRQGHRRHFPKTTLPHFVVLVMVPDHRRRKALTKEFRKQRRHDLWLFIVQEELRPETFLHEPITYDCTGKASPLIPLPKDP